MAQRRTLASFAIGGLLTRRTQSEEPWSVPFCAGDRESDFGETREGFAGMGKTACRHGDPIRLAVPGAHQLGTRLDPPGQFQASVGSGCCGLDQLIKEALG